TTGVAMTFLKFRTPTRLAVVVGAVLLLVTGCATDGDDPRISSTGGDVVEARPGDENVGQGSAGPGAADDSDLGSDGTAGMGGSGGICHFELVIDGVTTTAPDAATIAPDARILY